MRTTLRSFRARLGLERAGSKGQGIVEFSLIIPLLVILALALLEMVLALNASLAVSRASQHGAHVAATAGNLVGADCFVLQAVEEDLGPPNKVANVSEVLIERTSLVGNYVDLRQRWLRSGATDCALADGTTVEVPYVLVEGSYPAADRCTVLNGCPLLPNSPTTVDNIGVTVRYRHDWVTPLNGALTSLLPNEGGSPSTSGGWDFEQRNIFRVEPTL